MDDTSTSDLSSSNPVPWTDYCLISMICYISGGFYVKATGFSSGKPPFGVEDDGMITFTSSGSGRSVAASTILSWAYAAIA